MSNTDGEDTQKVSLGELLLNAGTRIVDLEKQSNDQVEIITHLEKQLASLREQLAGAEQQIKSLNEIIENLMNDEKDDMINLREQLTNEQDANALLKNAIDEADRQLKQKEDENRELLMKWISIRDKRPEYMETCIIHTSIGFVTMAQYGGGSPHKEVFVSGQEWHIATHWMSLPIFNLNLSA